MAPPPKAASSAIRRTASEDSDTSLQHGRSPTTLNAERAAAFLRGSEARTLDKSASSSNSSQEKGLDIQSEQADIVSSVALSLSNTSSPNTSQIPATPSSPLSSQSSDAINDTSASGQQRRTSDGSDTSNALQPRPQTTSGASPPRRRPPMYPPIRGPNRKSTSQLGSDIDSRRGSSPLTMRDLGSDYTRYFNPFTNSARSSFVETSRTPPSGQRVHATGPLIASPLSNPFVTPNASTAKLETNIDLEQNAALVDDRLAAPYHEKGDLSWPLITDKEEGDDDMHQPFPDDDIRFKPKWRDHFTKGNIASTIGLFFMAVGLLFIFVALPVLSGVGVIGYNSQYDTPTDQMPSYWPKPEPWAVVNNRTYPLMKNLRFGLIDPDTPKSALTMNGEYGDEYELVFSDEFNDNNRTFYEGDDPYWFAPDIWYGATQDLEWYDPDAVTTWDGTLELRLDKFINHGVNYRSGMLNSWNQLCFKGGIFEVSMSLPGPAAVMGLWPGAWTMGNLGRPGYLSTTEGLWPYTYQACDVGITPNQSDPSGLSRLPGQKLPSCTCPGEDHPTPGNGRGAPEIDIVEAGASYGGLPIATQSYQVAPFDIWWRPDYNFTAFPDYSLSYTNGYTGGPFQQAISATTNLNEDWYDGKAYQKYSFEYVPGEGEDAYIVWKVGGQTMFMMDGRAIGPNGNIAARQVSEEPMSMILNLGFSTSWTEIMWPKLVFPTVMRVDYVRWYQKKNQTMVTCDPPGYETTQYIKDHVKAYTNPNFTKWDETGYGWPKHKLNTDC